MNKLCECGCGREVTINWNTKQHNKFIHGHSRKGNKESYLKQAKDYKEKYGVEYPVQLKEVQEKFKQTCFKNHNVEWPMQSEEIKEKSKQTCFENYGFYSSNQSKEVQEKQKKSCFKKYGNRYPSKINEIKEKIKHTILKNYNVEWPMQSEEIKEKSKQTCFENCGFSNWRKTLQGRQSARINSIKIRDTQLANGEPAFPCIGYIERPCLNILQQHTQYNIIRNNNSFKYIVGRYPDGHIPELKLFIQFDERQHFENKEMTTYKEDDINCTLELASLGYIIFRISKKQWNENKEQVIEQFKILVKELSNGN